MDNLPYPRLQKNRPDYETALIDCPIDGSHTDNNINLRGQFDLHDGGLSKLIEEGNASYCLIIKCKATNRVDVYTDEQNVTQKFMLNLPKANYTDKIEITPGIIAKEEIPNYTNENLNADFRESSIVLPRHALIAQCETYDMTLWRNGNDSAESVVQFKADDRRGYNYNLNGDYIIITLPKEVFEQSNRLRLKECEQIFTTIYVLPVLQQVIQDYWVGKQDVDDDRPTTRWAQALEERIANMGFREDASAFEIATTLLKGMMFESSGYLAKHYGENDDLY